MTLSSCPRLFEVEARRDGRLAGAELTSFERHMASCPTCSREAQALERLARPLRAGSKDVIDELRVRRERTRLLSAFNQSLVMPQSRWTARRWLLASAALALLALGVFAVSRVQAPEQTAAVAAVTSAPGIVVRADSAALWSERTEGGRQKIVVERGALWIHVDPAPETRRLLVVLPDGELEDEGTTFTVRVENGRTARVAVEEGSVILRLRGRAPMTIGPEQAWTPIAKPTPPGPASAAPTAKPAAAALPSIPARTPLARPAPPAPSASEAPEAMSEASSDFRAALAALNGGSSREAAAKFTSFLHEHPRDARAEDAAYLRIIALQRSGDSAAMKEAALAYLRRYPTGFRRAEAETLSR